MAVTSRRARPDGHQISTARIAAAGLAPNPIGENLLKFYPTDPSGNLNVNAPNISNMNTFSVKFDHQLNASNLLNERVFWGSNFQSAPAGNSGEIIPPNGPIDMFNSVGDPTTALVELVWNSTFSNRRCSRRASASTCSQTPTEQQIVEGSGINTGPSTR